MKYVLYFGFAWFLTLPLNANADAVFEARDGDIRVVLHDTPCELSEVSNLPRKAVWHENGKTVEGCWGPRPDLGLVVMFFASDKTVGLAPMQAFRRVTGV